MLVYRGVLRPKGSGCMVRPVHVQFLVCSSKKKWVNVRILNILGEAATRSGPQMLHFCVRLRLKQARVGYWR